MKIFSFIGKHRIATVLGLVIVVATPTYFYYRGRGSEIKYTMATVSKGSITSVVQATGTVNALTTVPVGSFISGTVQYVFADYNTKVHAGQVLAQLDPAYYMAQYETAIGNLNNAKANVQNLMANINSMQATIDSDVANVAKLQAEADYTRVNTKRVHDLTIAGIATKDADDLAVSNSAQADAAVVAAKAQTNQARAQMEQAKAQLDEAKAQVAAQQGSLDQAETNLRYSTITSPIDGIVVARSITVGQSVAASLQAPNVFTIAQELKHMQIYAKTDESDTGNIHIGTEVTFQVDAFPNELWHGRVDVIHLNATTVQNVVTYDTVVDFENPDEKIFPGETAYVTIPTGQVDNTIMIPNAALSYTPDMPYADLRALYVANKIPRSAYTSHLGGMQVVWKKSADGKSLVPLAVKTGITDYINTQLISVASGTLNEGDQLVTFQEGGSKAAAGGTNPFSQQPPGRGGPGGGPGGGGGGRGGGR
ncbi:MAG TPA: efflux RND transporter periplasmic adaptor subunit [Candidatus Acidoferrales bacterium]|jgi:HlyD family secretion protein|nr:efflux RND transporter periplasmic adaptor subunit [Candidatus Acidoferrales bacterium]